MIPAEPDTVSHLFMNTTFNSGMYGVGLSEGDVAELAIHRPAVKALGYLLVAGGVVVVLVEVIASLGYVAVFVNLIVSVLGKRSEKRKVKSE